MRLPRVPVRKAGFWKRLRLTRLLPKGLYVRSLLIIIVPMVVLQTVVAFIFMERHWQTVTQRLSAAVVQDVAALVELWENDPRPEQALFLKRMAAENLSLQIEILPAQDLPPPGQKPFFSLLDQTLSKQVRLKVRRPFWIDTVGRSNLVEIRIRLDDAVLQVFAHRSQAYASNTHIFLLWMIGTSLVLLTLAILFLRNQIRPILALSEAAESFGKGRDVPGFRPRGALEVRQAAIAFLEMRRRIERQIEQRTMMLNGVSHDLRTVLTRFRLSLAFLGDTPEVEALTRDVDEMNRMLEAYLAFARGDSGEKAVPTSIHTLIESIVSSLPHQGRTISICVPQTLTAIIKPDAFRRLVTNLLSNALRHASTVTLSSVPTNGWMTLHIDDNGPGIPEDQREEVFRPFLRLDDARNLDEGGSGLGLAIARDIARAHGGDVVLANSPLGGLRASVRIPT